MYHCSLSSANARLQQCLLLPSLIYLCVPFKASSSTAGQLPSHLHKNTLSYWLDFLKTIPTPRKKPPEVSRVIVSTHIGCWPCSINQSVYSLLWKACSDDHIFLYDWTLNIQQLLKTQLQKSIRKLATPQLLPAKLRTGAERSSTHFFARVQHHKLQITTLPFVLIQLADWPAPDLLFSLSFNYKHALIRWWG